MPGRNLISVSYTHLDVYKRQGGTGSYMGRPGSYHYISSGLYLEKQAGSYPGRNVTDKGRNSCGGMFRRESGSAAVIASASQIKILPKED